MSPLLQNFRNLVGMEIFNSTIVEWPKSASLVQERHPHIGYLIISRSNFTSFPEGLRGPLPHSLCDIEISTTNLTQLPSDLHERWTSVTTLYVEYSNLSSLPFSLAQLPLNDLSLVGNKISRLDLPEWKYESEFCSQATRLSLGYNPLQALPSHGFCDSTGIAELAIDGTAIKELPPWIKSVKDHIYAFKTPLCDSQSTEEVEGSPQRLVFSCEDSNHTRHGNFSTTVIREER